MPTILEAVQLSNSAYLRAENITARLDWAMGGWQCIVNVYDGRIWREASAKVFRWAWIFDQHTRDEAAEWLTDTFLKLARELQHTTP
jgi:hypothetical protein